MVDGPQESMTVTYVRAAAVGYDPFLKFGKPMEGVNTCTDTRCFLAVHTLFLFCCNIIINKISTDAQGAGHPFPWDLLHSTHWRLIHEGKREVPSGGDMCLDNILRESRI
jgi:hypothetical protein